MSKAFTREEAEPPVVVAPRAPLPDDVPNYVTSRGLAQLREEFAELEVERGTAERSLEGVSRSQALAALAVRRSSLAARIASAVLVLPPTEPEDTVRFGATVTVTGKGTLRRVSIVGVDEAQAPLGKIAFVSPLARALLGRAVGDTLRLRTPRGEEPLEIVSVAYGLPADADSEI